MKNKVENVVFHCLAEERKIGETENRKESSSSWAHFFYPPKLGRKWGVKSVVKCILHKYPLTPHFIHDLITFAPLHPYHFTFSQHSNVQVLFSLFFFFFFLPNCWQRWIITRSFAHKSLLTTFLWVECSINLLTTFLLVSKSFAQLNLYVHYCNFYIIIIKIII